MKSTQGVRAIANPRLWVLTAAHTTNDFYGGAVAALLPFFILYAGYSYVQVAGITLAVTALSSITQPFFGYLSDRYGLRWMSVAGLLASGAGVAFSGLLVDSYIGVCIVVAITGLGTAAYHPSATIEARAVGGGTSGAMSLFSVGGSLGVALAPAGVVLAIGIGGLQWTVVLFAPAIVMAAIYLLVTASYRRADAVTMASPKPPVAALPDDWKAFGLLTVVLVMWSIAQVSTSTFVTVFSIERFGSDASQAALALVYLSGAAAVGTLAGGWLADRYGRLRISRLGYLGAAASAVAILTAPSIPVFHAALAAWGLMLFLPFAAHITLAHSYLPNRIGMASGVALGLTFSLGGLAVPLLGAVAEQSGVGVVFVVVTVLILVGFGLSFLLRERQAPRTDAEVAADEEEIADLT